MEDEALGVHAHSRLAVVAPSGWLVGLAENGLFGRLGIRVHHVPYGFDLTRFSPQDKTEAKRALGLDPARPALLFGAADVRHHRKGADLLGTALARLTSKPGAEPVLVAMGEGLDELQRILRRPVVSVGYLRDDAAKRQVYSAADLFVLPTRADNQPCVVLEAMACGTPCVAFGVGGVGEVVVTGRTGYAARPGDVGDLAAGIGQLLSDDPLRRACAEESRRVTTRDHDLTKQALAYRAIYEELLGAN